MYVDIYYGFTLLFLVLTLVFATILLKRYVAFYLNFPNGSFLLIVLRWIVMSTIKKNPAATKSLLETLHETCSKLQKEGICVLWLHKPFVVICNVKTTKAFCNVQCAVSKPPEYKILKEGFGVSISTADADVWRFRRKMLNPAFKISVLKNHAPMINESAITLVNKLMAVPKETPVDVLRLVQSCAFEIIYEFISGNMANDPETQAELENAIDIVNIIGNMMTYRLLRPWLYPVTTLKFFSKGRIYLEALRKGHDFSKNILLEMKESVLSNKENDTEKDGFYDAPKSFAQLLVQQHIKNPEFSFKDMNDELNGLISADKYSTQTSIMGQTDYQ